MATYIGKAPVNGFHTKQTLSSDGSTTTFTLDTTVATESSIIVSVGGIIQEPGVAYNLAQGGTKITFTGAPAATDTVYIQYLGQTISQTITDLNGSSLILDDDQDTTIGASTDDQILFTVGGTANATYKTTGVHNPDSIKFVAGTGDDMQMYHDGSNSYLTNSTGALKLATETSGIAVTIGHSTSEVTIADNATVTGNLTVTGTLTQTGTQTFDGGIDVDNFNINGTTIALSSGDMTLDAAGDIILDGDGGDIFFKDAGTTFGSATNSSGNLILKSGTTTAATFSGANVTLAGTVGSGAITSTSTVSDAVSNVRSGRKNIIINGGIDVWQRGTSFSHTSGKNFVCDRWWVNPSSVTGTQTQQASGLDGANYALRIQRTENQTGTGLQYLQTELESADSMQFRGKKLTLSFYARKGANFSQSSSQLTSNVATGTGTDQSLINGFTGGTNALSQNNTLTTSWQRFSHTTGSVLASNVNQLAVQFTHSPAGTAGANDYYEITGVQLEVGEAATDFEYRSYGEELALCQRYYEQCPEVAEQFPLAKGRESDRIRLSSYQFQVTKRSNPSVTLLSPTVGGSGTGTPAASGIGIFAFRATCSMSADNASPYFNGYKADSEL